MSQTNQCIHLEIYFCEEKFFDINNTQFNYIKCIKYISIYIYIYIYIYICNESFSIKTSIYLVKRPNNIYISI